MLRRRILSATLLTTAVAVAVAANGPAALADTPPVSQARGVFLTGAVAGTDLTQAANLPTSSGNPLTGAVAVNTGGPTVEQANPQGLGDLGTLGVPVPSGGTIPVGEGLQFGVLNQYAAANPDGSAASSSGAIADNGTIQAGGAAGGTAGNATLDLDALGRPLTDALPAALQDLTDVKLTAGALAARATQAAFDPAGTPGVQRGSYQIGSLTLSLRSAALTALVDQVRDAYAAAETALTDALTTALTALAPADAGVVAVQLGDLPDPLAVFGDAGAVAADGVTVDLGTGRISIDLAALVQAVTGQDINTLPPNTDLLALLQQALASTDLVRIVAGQLQNVVEAGRDFLLETLGTTTATITVAGVPIAVSGGTLLTLLGVDAATALPGVDALTTALGSLTDGLQSTVGTLLGTLGTSLSQLVGLVANRQVTDAGAFTETALALTLLPGGLPGASDAAVLDLGLASASVGPGARPAVATTTPVATPTTSVPMLANTGPLETLGGLAVGTWALVAGAFLLATAGAVVGSRRLHLGAHRH